MIHSLKYALQASWETRIISFPLKVTEFDKFFHSNEVSADVTSGEYRSIMRLNFAVV